MVRAPILVPALGLLAASFWACEHKQASPPPPPATPAATPAPAAAPLTGPKGDIEGTVIVAGKLPEMTEFKRSPDLFCGKTPMKDDVVQAKGGKLKNVLVHVNGAPPQDPPREHAVIAQHNCTYRPRVLGVQTGQAVDIKNADETVHNVHIYKGATTQWNLAQVPHAPDLVKTFGDAALYKIKCDVHPGTTGYVWVQNNPWFAVSDDDGRFTIKGVPAGKYEIEAWHERFGTKKVVVMVAEGKPTQVSFDFSADQPR